MPIRALRSKLREIDRNSRRKQRNIFDRWQSAAFVVAAVLAPLIVLRLETWYVRSSDEVLAAAFAFRNRESEQVLAAKVPVTPVLRPPSGILPLAELRLVSTRSWRGWPLATSDHATETRVDVALLATCPEYLRDEVAAAGEGVFAQAGLVLPTPKTTVHVGGWIFSIGAWWVLLTVAAALVLAPLRFAFRVRKTVRNVVRQGRIDRCHCPNCGYDGRGSITTGRCPECGGDLYERPDW